MKMGTARLAHLGLAGSALHVGVRFDELPSLRALAAEPPGRVALLYPGPDAVPIELDRRARRIPSSSSTAPGTRRGRCSRRSPLLPRVPRVSLHPETPSTYRRIRREPAEHCMSNARGDRRGARRARKATPSASVPPRRLRAPGRDANSATPARGACPIGTSTSVEGRGARAPREAPRPPLCGRRARAGGGQSARRRRPARAGAAGGLAPATGERFARIVRPRCPVASRTPARLGLPADLLASRIDAGDLADAWGAFVRPTDVLVVWGRFTPCVLAAERAAAAPWMDLRGEVASAARRMRRPVRKALRSRSACNRRRLGTRARRSTGRGARRGDRGLRRTPPAATSIAGRTR
jgi:hypothetical protein